MYLSDLNIGEKKNFLELAKYSIGLNGENKPEEQIVYQSYVQECGLADYSISKQDNIDSAIKVLTKSNNKSKRIILLELYGILLADGEVCQAESEFMQKLSCDFTIDDYETKKIQRWVCAMNDLASEGYALIEKG